MAGALCAQLPCRGRTSSLCGREFAFQPPARHGRERVDESWLANQRCVLNCSRGSPLATAATQWRVHFTGCRPGLSPVSSSVHILGHLLPTAHCAARVWVNTHLLQGGCVLRCSLWQGGAAVRGCVSLIFPTQASGLPTLTFKESGCTHWVKEAIPRRYFLECDVCLFKVFS